MAAMESEGQECPQCARPEGNGRRKTENGKRDQWGMLWVERQAGYLVAQAPDGLVPSCKKSVV